MGQFQGQPDFGTIAAVLTPTDTISSATNLNSACIYVGGPAPIANITCILSGVTGIQGTVTAVTIINGGTGYANGAGVAVTPASGLGTGCTVDTVATGPITSIVVATLGSDYRDGDVLTIAGGNGDAQIRISVTDLLPDAGDAVTFTGYPAGSFLPVIVDYVLATGTTGVNMLAIK
tara:strand:- start:5753 stop:6280 length:528 start_codon:yes stop_codon:yes gene_type:complete